MNNELPFDINSLTRLQSDATPLTVIKMDVNDRARLPTEYLDSCHTLMDTPISPPAHLLQNGTFVANQNVHQAFEMNIMTDGTAQSRVVDTTGNTG